MFILLRRAFLLGLAAATLVSSRATGDVSDYGHILRRGISEPQGDTRIPPEIHLGGEIWSRADILRAINTPVNQPKSFGNHGVELQSNKWVPKSPLFEGAGSKLTEYDLTKNPAIRGKFRAITTKNKNFIGITEHVADNNVKSIWDVKVLTREGFWLKLGDSSNTVTGTNGLRFARKEIAAAMQSTVREKVGGKLWKSNISPMGGGTRDVFNVVYEGNEFKHIEDASGAKVFERQGPACRRDATKRDCGPDEEVGESEVEDSEGLTSNEGEDSTAEPGKGVEGSETPANTEGEESAPEPASPEPEEGVVSPESPESVELAEKLSEEEFINFATTRGMVKSVTETLSLSIKDIRTKALGYKPLTPKSPSFKIRPGKVASGATSTVAALAVPLWVKGMVDAFKNDINDLDKAAAVTAIVPVVGCTTNLAAEAWDGDVDGLDTAMCYTGDALLFTPLAPVGVAIHVLRWFISLAKPPKVPEKEEFVQHRDSQWEQFLGENVYTYIYSDSKKSFKAKEKSFRAKLNSSLTIQGLAVISEGAQRIGAAQVLAQNSLKTSENATAKTEIEKGALQAVDGIRAAVWNETIRRQRAYLLELPDTLREKTEASLKPMSEEFNKDYIEKVTSIEMATHYFQADLFPRNPGPLPDTEPGNLALVQAQLKSIAAHLKTQPLPLPKSFTLAYIIGQSKGLGGLDPLVLSPRDYLSQQAEPKLSEGRINFFSLFHTLEVAKLLHGSLKEGELSNPWKSDIKDARPLHLLIAMKFGKAFEERKGSGAGGPDIPPLQHNGPLESAPSLAAITGLSEEIVKNLPKEGEFLRYRDLISEPRLLAMQRLAQDQSARKAGDPEQTTTARAEI